MNHILPGWMPLAACCLITGLLPLAAAGQVADAAVRGSPEQRLRQLEDRAEIDELLHAYGHTLDQRDFPGFESLFAADAEYHGGGDLGLLTGPPAIRTGLERIMADNPLKLPEPNFHVFFNISIEIDGDRATSTSQSAFIVPGAEGRPQMIFLAAYEDVLVRAEGRWKFRSRIVHSLIP